MVVQRPLILIGLVVLASGFAVACGSEFRNPCGSEGATTFRGAVAVPGDSCGECGVGVLVCGTEGNELQCVGSESLNACGGCGPLDAAPGDACGLCGRWACESADTLACEESTNVCGGCRAIEGCASDDECRDVEVCSCTGPDTAECIRADRNACGGFSTLDNQPGAICGPCGIGRFVCEGSDETACRGASDGDCACVDGITVVGSGCGSCGGSVWQCVDADLSCSEVHNACGGCAELPAELGEACRGGTWSCVGTEAMACTSFDANACGGTETLPAIPGQPCSDLPCGVSRWVCAGENHLRCVGGTPANACNGCGPLPARPGDGCGPQARWLCDGGSLRCAPVKDPECGDGHLDGGEDCDLGPDNGAPGRRCTTDCQRDGDGDGTPDIVDCDANDPDVHQNAIRDSGGHHRSELRPNGALLPGH